MFPNSRPVASTVLEENINFPDKQEDGTPIWLSMYKNSLLLVPPKEQLADSGREQSRNFPKISQSYNDNVRGNVNTTYQLKQNGMMNQPSAPLQPPLTLPTFKPPYGTPYPSSGYSAFDAEVANATKIPMAVAGPSLPIGTPAALADARGTAGVNIDKKSYQQELDKNFKEGYNQGKGTAPSCGQSIHHVLTCSVCRGAIMGNTKVAWILLGLAGIFILFLLFLLFKQQGQSIGSSQKPGLVRQGAVRHANGFKKR